MLSSAVISLGAGVPTFFALSQSHERYSLRFLSDGEAVNMASFWLLKTSYYLVKAPISLSLYAHSNLISSSLVMLSRNSFEFCFKLIVIPLNFLIIISHLSLRFSLKEYIELFVSIKILLCFML